jgi:lipoprotein-anchoring transpeptidase ErfK/SrfK
VKDVSRTFRTVLAVILASALLAVPLAPALADDGSLPPAPATIPAGVVVGGIDVSGLTGDAAFATLTANLSTPTLAPIAVDATGTIYTLNALSAVSLDATGLVDQALAATTPVDTPASYTINPAVITRFVANLAKHTDRTMINAVRKIVKRKLVLGASRVGLHVNQAATATSITVTLGDELAAGGSKQATVTATITATQPKVTAKNIGKTIIVVLGTCRLYLYNGAKLEKSYRCAVGQARYPTPKGTWKVVQKVKNPSWYNNGAAWARNMPSFIGPGRNNPLGTRALYLNASGIRIHGIPASENSSIGHHASHGCIRLKNSDAINLYPRVAVGTPVYIIK